MQARSSHVQYVAAPPSIKGVYCSSSAFPFNSYFVHPSPFLSPYCHLSLPPSHLPSILPFQPRHMYVHCQSIWCECMYIRTCKHTLFEEHTVCKQAYNKERSTVQQKNALHTNTESSGGHTYSQRIYARIIHIMHILYCLLHTCWYSTYIHYIHIIYIGTVVDTYLQVS